ncbi:MAG: hypothetical protein HC800_24795 [Phormidesmis sp. RL_2_1]|nr:hypothetical protein [Phormidesmis sp. RL_2_1]
MDSALQMDLSGSPYQQGDDFTLEPLNNGWYSWTGAGCFEGDHCAFESFRTVEQATADALFRLAIADGQDTAKAVLIVFSAGLPTGYLDLENIDYP